MSKSMIVIDTPIDCCSCPFGTMVFGKDVCLLCEGNMIDCPLKPYEDAIPREWVQQYIDNIWAGVKEEYIPIEWLKNWAETGGDEPVDDFTDVDAYCDGYQKNVIECLLRAWEKETREEEDIIFTIAKHYNLTVGTAHSDYARELLESFRNTAEWQRMVEYVEEMKKVHSFEQQRELEDRLRKKYGNEPDR